MAKIILDEDYQQRLEVLDAIIDNANVRKRNVLFDALGIQPTERELAGMQVWKLIAVTVPDNQMAVQLNKIVAYTPNLMFVVDATVPLFSVREGEKKRRVRKER